MPYNDPDSTDPMTLHGVAVQTHDDGAMREMAACFIEEYARLGFDADRILRMFQTQGYAGPFLAYRTLGENAIRSLIGQEMSLRNHGRSQEMRDPDGRPESRSHKKVNGRISLPVLNP